MAWLEGIVMAVIGVPLMCCVLDYWLGVIKETASDLAGIGRWVRAWRKTRAEADQTFRLLRSKESVDGVAANASAPGGSALRGEMAHPAAVLGVHGVDTFGGAS